ncbi:MAG TPA: cyclodeaminase/cyclohydrolase family protein [Tissierellia bacterium]|jgi:formiminotetrahydrofolate cyclodeaminase|nr:cyclodeaminase/cyclohydrolase family protein [Tissierellia bacterium]
MLTDLSCKDFTAELSSKKPIPGGGGAAALAGSLGVALNMMVANFSKGKKKFLQYEKQHEDILERGEKLRIKLLNLVEEDAKNFEPLSKAYAMPSSTEEERANKEKEMERCLKNACKAPMEIMELAYEGILLHEELLSMASKIIISDIGVGVQLLKAALNSGYLNILINIKLIKDKQYVENVVKRTEEILRAGNKKVDEIYAEVLEILS